MSRQDKIWGAGYNLLAPGRAVAATVYVYPAPSLISIGSPSDVVASARATLCKTEFERRKGELIGAHPGARQIGEKDAPLPQGGPPLPGKWPHSSMMIFSQARDCRSIPNCT